MKEKEPLEQSRKDFGSNRALRIISGKPIIDRDGKIIGFKTCDGSLDYASPIKEDIWIDIKIKK